MKPIATYSKIEMKGLTHNQLLQLKPSQQLISQSVINLNDIFTKYNVIVDDSPLGMAFKNLQDAERKFFAKFTEALDGQENQHPNKTNTESPTQKTA